MSNYIDNGTAVNTAYRLSDAVTEGMDADMARVVWPLGNQALMKALTSLDDVHESLRRKCYYIGRGCKVAMIKEETVND